MKKKLAAAALALSVVAASGCVSDGLNKPALAWPWAAKDDGRGEIAQVAAVWADGLVMQADPAQGGRITPGFAGRVYFFNQDMSQTRQADGTLTISLYDNTQAAAADPPPKEVWNLDAATLASIQKRDAVGWGYNIWLPWSTMSAKTNAVTLVVEYRDPTGRPLWSAPTTFPVRTGAGWQAPSPIQVTKRTSQPPEKPAP